ncbi:MAG: NTP transferase domain-containing protein, partial [Promethearchaeota archaeon]
MSKISNYSKSIAITILIGGKSTRFGNDKGLFEFNNKSLISYELDTLKQGNFDIFLVAHSSKQVQNYIDNIDISQIVAFIIDTDFFIADSSKRTPLLGIYSGFKELQNLGYQKSLIIPCDIPLINLDVVKLMIKESFEYDCCIPRWENNLL